MKSQSLAFFKAYKGQGTALTISVGKKCFFFSILPEEGERKFNSKKKITVAMGQNDIGEILSVIKGYKEGVGSIKDGKFTGLYHEVKGKSVTSIHFFKMDNADKFLFGLSKKIGSDNTKLSINLTIPDLMLIEAFIIRNINVIFENEYGVNNSTDAPPQRINSSKSQVISTKPSDDIPF